MSSRKQGVVVRMNMAQSIDGHIIEPDGRWHLGGAEDKRRMDQLRAWCDYLVTSRSSLVADDAPLYIRRKPQRKKQPIPIIVLQNLQATLDRKMKVFKAPHPPGVIFYQGQPDTSFEESLADLKGRGWQIFAFSNVKEIIAYVEISGLNRILLEGGGVLNGLFLAEDLVDEIYFTLVPHAWGGRTHDRIFVSDEYLPIKNFKIKNVERRKNEVYFRYLRK